MYLSNLRDARVRAGYSQAGLSRTAKVGRDAISEYESLKRQAQPATVERLAAVLDVESAALYGEQPSPPPVFRELRAALAAAHERGGREEQIAELERFLARDPERLRRWLYEQTIEELMARQSLAGREYGEAARGAGRATTKALEFFPVLALVLLELVQELLERGGSFTLPPAENMPENTPETAPVSRPRKSTESHMDAEEEG